jgi:hypothetical protein
MQQSTIAKSTFFPFNNREKKIHTGFRQEKWKCRYYHIITTDLAGCTISSELTSLVTDFRSTSDGLTRESSFSPKLQQNRKQKTDST